MQRKQEKTAEIKAVIHSGRSEIRGEGGRDRETERERGNKMTDERGTAAEGDADRDADLSKCTERDRESKREHERAE